MLERSLCSIVVPWELFQSLHIQTRSMLGVGTKHAFQGYVGGFSVSLQPCADDTEGEGTIHPYSFNVCWGLFWVVGKRGNMRI